MAVAVLLAAMCRKICRSFHEMFCGGAFADADAGIHAVAVSAVLLQSFDIGRHLKSVLLGVASPPL